LICCTPGRRAAFDRVDRAAEQRDDRWAGSGEGNAGHPKAGLGLEHFRGHMQRAEVVGAGLLARVVDALLQRVPGRIGADHVNTVGSAVKPAIGLNGFSW